MEGNFYVSETAITRELASRLGHAFTKCAAEAKDYGKCVEGFQINKELKKDACQQQRLALRACADIVSKAARKSPSKSRGQ